MTELIQDIRTRHRTRVDFHRSETKLTLQMGAICRRYAGGDPKTNKARGKALLKECEKVLGGHVRRDTQVESAADADEGHLPSDTLVTNALVGNQELGGQVSCDTQVESAADADEGLAEHDALNGNALVGQALCVTQNSNADEGLPSCNTPKLDALVGHLTPLHLARAHVRASRKSEEKALKALAKELPVYPWVEGIRGFAALTLGQIIGETGDLAMYGNPAKLWKRMGLAVIDGERQRKCIDKKMALAHGYSPQRRSIMWNVGGCLIKAGGEMKVVYDDRKRYEYAKDKDMRPCIASARAQRYMEKRLLRELWRQWRAS